MTCPSCGAASLSPLTGTCTLCGFASASVATANDDRIVARARAELAHEFDLVDPVGRGARSAVFIARERNSGRDVMLKVVERIGDPRDSDALFRATLAAQTTFDHPHLVPVLRHGVTDSLFWFTRENIRATPLSDVLAQGTRLDVRQCRRIATQLCSALDYLHRRGMIHGALKSSNVLLDAQGWVHLCDPAIPTGRTPARRTPVTTWGDEHSPARDQHALASVLHEGLTGLAPDTGHAALLADPSVPSAVGAVIARALSPEPRDRFPSLTDFVWALEGGTSVPATARASSATNEVLFIADWKAPDDPNRLLKLVLRAAFGAAVAAVAWIVYPTVSGALWPQPVRSPIISAPAVAAPPAASGAAGNTASAEAALAPPAVTPPTVTPEPRVRSTVAPPPAVVPAVLSINSTPWGVISIDGVVVGNTPRRNHPVTPGARVLRVTRDGFTPFERTLRLAPGDTVRLTDIVLVPRGQ